MDFEVSAELVVEIKAVEALLPVHEAQLISYLRLTRIPAGLLLNFRAETIRRGLRRLTLNPPNLPDLPPSCDHTQKLLTAMGVSPHFGNDQACRSALKSCARCRLAA